MFLVAEMRTTKNPKVFVPSAPPPTLSPRARCSYSRADAGQKQKFRASSASRYCAVAASSPLKWTSAGKNGTNSIMSAVPDTSGISTRRSVICGRGPEAEAGRATCAAAESDILLSTSVQTQLQRVRIPYWRRMLQPHQPSLVTGNVASCIAALQQSRLSLAASMIIHCLVVLYESMLSLTEWSTLYPCAYRGSWPHLSNGRALSHRHSAAGSHHERRPVSHTGCCRAASSDAEAPCAAACTAAKDRVRESRAKTLGSLNLSLSAMAWVADMLPAMGAGLLHARGENVGARCKRCRQQHQIRAILVQKHPAADSADGSSAFQTG